MPNHERFFDVGRHVVVVEASRYWNFYEGVLIGNGEGGSRGGSCPEWNSFSRIRRYHLGTLIKFYLCFMHACRPVFDVSIVLRSARAERRRSDFLIDKFNS